MKNVFNHVYEIFIIVMYCGIVYGSICISVSVIACERVVGELTKTIA